MIKRFRYRLAALFMRWSQKLDKMPLTMFASDAAVKHLNAQTPEALRELAQLKDGVKYRPEYELREVFIDRSGLERLTLDFEVLEDELENVRRQMLYAEPDVAELRIDQVAQRLLLQKLAREIEGSRPLADAAVMYKDTSPERHYRGLYRVALNFWVEAEDRPLTNFIAKQTNDDCAEMTPFKRKR